MPSKNVSLYVGDAISALLEAPFQSWELIVVEDHSSDNTLEVTEDLARQDSRIRVVRNTGDGKVAGLNYGYSLTRGTLIKCIDADDQLSPEFFAHLSVMSRCDAMCHDMAVTTNDLNVVGKYAIDQSFFRNDFAQCLRHLKGLPRCTWLFTREVGDRIFPMPLALPFEDVWFSLVIKKYAKEISYIGERLYSYRQHGNQTFGGVLCFDRDVVIFRAKRMLRLLALLEGPHGACLTEGVASGEFFEEIRLFYTLMAQRPLSLRDIIHAPLGKSLKAKLLTYRKLQFFAPHLIRAKWFWDDLRAHSR